MKSRPIEQEDIRYLYVAYKKGKLTSMGGVFENTDMNPEEFKEAFQAEILENYHGAWTLFAQNDKGPVGVVLGFWSHQNPERAPFMIVGDMLWMPWASTRNVVESAVHFFNNIRNEIPMMEYAEQKDKKFFEMMCRHGVMRRVGTAHSVYKDRSVSVFETRHR